MVFIKITNIISENIFIFTNPISVMQTKKGVEVKTSDGEELCLCGEPSAYKIITFSDCENIHT